MTESTHLSHTATLISSAEIASEQEAQLAVAVGMLQREGIQRWIEQDSPEPHLVVVFTDIVNSTRINNDLGDLEMDKIKTFHFDALERHARRYKGRILKGTGDGVMAIFRSALHGIQFSIAAYTSPGHDSIQLRTGCHMGRVRARGGDIFGQTVNFASRIQGALTESGMAVSEEVKRDIERALGARQAFLRFDLKENLKFKGFDGSQHIWVLQAYSDRLPGMSFDS